MNDLVKSEVDRIVGEPEPRGKFTAKRVSVKKSALRVATEEFIEEDLGDIKSDLKRSGKRLLKSLVGEFLIDSITRFFLSGSKKNYSNVTTSSVVRNYGSPSYRNYSASSVSRTNDVTKRRFDFSDLIYAQRSDCQWLLDILQDKIASSSKHRVSVMELYDEIGDPSNLEMNDDQFGWTDLSDGRAYIREVGEGFRLFLPPVEEFRD